LWQWVKAGKFPQPIKLADNVTVWKASDVYGWLESHGA
jgi:predicted DNA-binding transcriptional regulator AlpA